MSPISTSNQRTPPSSRLAVFDVCGTLYRSNTTFDFLRYLIKTGVLPRHLTEILLGPNLFIKSGFKMFERISGKSLLKPLVLRALAGIPSLAVYEAATGFVATELAEVRIETTHRLLENAKTQGRVMLISSSVEPVVRAVAQHLGNLEYIASTLEESNGILTGRVACEQHSRKLQSLRKVDSLLSTELTVVTDNRSDLQLMQEAQHRVAVVWSLRDLRFWQTFEGVRIEALF